jgi:hypothetical protein
MYSFSIKIRDLVSVTKKLDRIYQKFDFLLRACQNFICDQKLVYEQADVVQDT